MKRLIQQLIREEIENVLSEGIHDPGILKAVFFTGGPGSGKSYASRILFGIQSLKTMFASTTSSGLKIINSDTIFEKMLRDANVEMTRLGKIEKEDPAQWADIMKLRNKAKALTSSQLKTYLQGRLGILIDTTGSNIENIRRQNELMENLGYDTYLIFVNTSLNVALERNRFRGTQGERTLSDDMVKEIWHEAQENLGELQKIIGSENVLIIDNTKSGPIEASYKKAVEKIVSAPIKNYLGKLWIKNKNKQ